MDSNPYPNPEGTQKLDSSRIRILTNWIRVGYEYCRFSKIGFVESSPNPRKSFGYPNTSYYSNSPSIRIHPLPGSVLPARHNRTASVKVGQQDTAEGYRRAGHHGQSHLTTVPTQCRRNRGQSVFLCACCAKYGISPRYHNSDTQAG